MTFNEARQEFLNALMGEVVERSFPGTTNLEVRYPPEDVLHTLSSVNDAMDKDALDVFREEIVGQWFSEDDPSLMSKRLTWGQAVLFIREHRRRSANYGFWYCPSCGNEIYDTAENMMCVCGAD